MDINNNYLVLWICIICYVATPLQCIQLKQEKSAKKPSWCKPEVKCYSTSKYSNIDGSCHNLENPHWGMANSAYSRLLPQAYGDGIGTPRVAIDKSQLPSARKVRLAVFPTGSKPDQSRSLAAMQWGQVLTHDMSMQQESSDGRCCTENAQFQDQLSDSCFPIDISPKDPELGHSMSCMNFTRSVSDKDIGCSISATIPAKKINGVTSWIDLSIVYDTDVSRNKKLRAGVHGRMKVVSRGGSTFPPQDTNGAEKSCKCNRPGENICYLGGDTRINQSPHLTILQIILLREHNRLAMELMKINPKWNDEKLFQEARRINIAQHQYISYYEWMPTILGFDNLVENEIIFPDFTDYVNDYDCSLSPDVTSEQAQAAFRHFHSQIAEMLGIMDVDGNVESSLNISAFIHRPSVLEFDHNFIGLSRGLLMQNSENADEINIPAMTNRFEACNEHEFGLDLRSVDIQRDRDHGIRYYNDYRKYCGIGEAKNFDGFKDYIPKSAIKKLQKLYKSHMDVDLTVGGGLEKKVGGSQVGPTFLCILLEQFKRTRRADRFWFEHEEAGFTIDQLNEIRKSSLSRLFCDNEKGIKKVQRNGFLSVKANSPDLVPCSSIPRVDLRKWKE